MNTKFKKNSFFVNNTLKFKVLIVFLAASLFTTSCEDILEEKLYSDFEGDSFYKDVGSAELGLFGVYDILGTQYRAGGYLISFFTGTDQERFWRAGRGNNDDLLANYQIEENNAEIGKVWSLFYNGIYRNNFLIDRVTVPRDDIMSIADKTSEQITELEAYNNVLGEAYFLRAFMYFQLVKNWGDVPLRLTSDVLTEGLKIERTPKEDVYAQIEEDMIKAIELLPDAPNVKSPGRVSKGAAQGIFARIYLNWAGSPVSDVSKFEKAVKQAMDVVSSGYYELNTNIELLEIGAPFNHPFPEVFKNLAKKVFDYREIMWEIHFSYIGTDNSDASTLGIAHGVKQHTRSIYKRGTPRRYYLPTFYDSFEDGDEVRRDYSIAQFEINSSNIFKAIDRTRNTSWGSGKFRRYLIDNPSPNNNFDIINWPIIRYADVLLMLAESINETILNGGNLPEGASIEMAYDAVNEVRRRARILPIDAADPSVDLSGSGGDTFRQQIRNERSWELCGENLRKPDLIRWGILVETVRQTGVDMNAAGFTDDNDYFPAVNISDKNVLLPIPFGAEISQNPDVLNTDPTNNGYR